MDAKDRRIAQLEAALRAARLTHHYESDAPCPLTLRPGERGDLGDACTCGVGEHNAAIDQALAGSTGTAVTDASGGVYERTGPGSWASTEGGVAVVINEGAAANPSPEAVARAALEAAATRGETAASDETAFAPWEDGTPADGGRLAAAAIRRLADDLQAIDDIIETARKATP